MPDEFIEYDPLDMESIHDSFAYIVSEANTLRLWVVNYTDRTGIRINLFFNLATQSDNLTNLEIARLSSKISTQRDSSSMITCASLYVYWGLHCIQTRQCLGWRP